MPITAIVGEQRGDEGKGRFVDMLMPEFDIGARFNGGDNAGHTVVTPDGVEYYLHGMPTSIVHEGKRSVIGNGTVINPARLVIEMATLRDQGVEISSDNFFIDNKAHLVFPSYLLEDEKIEKGKKAQGTTKSGIAQTYAPKVSRTGLRTHDINNRPEEIYERAYQGLREQRGPITRRLGIASREDDRTARDFLGFAQELGEFVTDATRMLNMGLREENPVKILAEGAQAFLLDNDQGMYPWVSSSTTTTAGVAEGLGVPGSFLEQTIGVSKAIQSHVGGGPFVTEIDDPDLLEKLHGSPGTVDAERGTTTGRTRRLGNLDLVQIRRAQYVNGTDLEGGVMALTKLDWIPRYGDKAPICVGYKSEGKVNDGFYRDAPSSGAQLENCEPEYEYLPTWKEDIQNVRNFNNLPSNAQTYIKFIEGFLGVHVAYIGVGPQRDQVIVR
jgi:adenylosuccinate synthase